MKQCLILIFLITSLNGADVGSIVRSLNERMASVQDLQVNLFVRSRMPNMTVPDRTGILYFKRPDKVYIDGTGFMMIPKEALLMDFSVLMQDSLVTLTLEEPDSLAGSHRVLINVERWENNRLFLMNVVIDTLKWTISQIGMNEGSQFKGNIAFKHTEVLDGVWLPSEVKMTIESEGKTGKTVKNPRVRRIQKPGNDEEGYFLLKFTGYHVNNGIDDSRFPAEESEE